MHKACNSDLNFYVYNRGNLTLTHTYKRATAMLQNVDTPTRTLAILNLKVCFSHSSLDICCLYRLKRVNSLLQLVSTACIACKYDIVALSCYTLLLPRIHAFVATQNVASIWQCAALVIVVLLFCCLLITSTSRNYALCNALPILYNQQPRAPFSSTSRYRFIARTLCVLFIACKLPITCVRSALRYVNSYYVFCWLLVAVVIQNILLKICIANTKHNTLLIRKVLAFPTYTYTLYCNVCSFATSTNI